MGKYIVTVWISTLVTFTQKMRAEKLDVKTSAPSVGKFYKTFLDIFEQGSDEILCITISNKLSSTYNSALLAANMIHAKIAKKRVVVFDSLTAAVARDS